MGNGKKRTDIITTLNKKVLTLQKEVNNDRKKITDLENNVTSSSRLVISLTTERDEAKRDLIKLNRFMGLLMDRHNVLSSIVTVLTDVIGGVIQGKPTEDDLARIDDLRTLLVPLEEAHKQISQRVAFVIAEQNVIEAAKKRAAEIEAIEKNEETTEETTEETES
jgi:hypothetical protein